MPITYGCEGRLTTASLDRLAVDYDADKVKDSLAKTLAKIKPWTLGSVPSGTPA